MYKEKKFMPFPPFQEYKKINNFEQNPCAPFPLQKEKYYK